MLPTETMAEVIKLEAEKKIPHGNLMAVVDVESNGKVYEVVGGKRLPLILFEPHILYRLTTGDARDKLVDAGLAYSRWGSKPYPKTQAERWQQVLRAKAIAGDVAYEAASYGVGQVLGEHWKTLGFASIAAFMERMTSGIDGQLDIMMRFIVENGLLDEIQDGRWPAFFRGYNGPAWKKNGYGDKIAAALARYGGNQAATDGTLRLGAKGARVREVQALLNRAGYQLYVDGDYGPATVKVVRRFQGVKKIKVDGVVGPETEKALTEYRQGEGDKPGKQKPRDIGGVVNGTAVAIGAPAVTGLAADGIDQAKSTLEPYAGSNQWIDTLLAVLIVAGVIAGLAGGAWAAYAWWKSRQTQEA